MSGFLASVIKRNRGKQMSIIINDVLQGTEEWHELKRGVISASGCAELLTNGRGGKPSATRASYLAGIASAILGGKSSDYSSSAMQRGNDLEPFARQAYMALSGNKVNEVGFVFKDDIRRAGCSPDGLIGEVGGIEIKCPGGPQYMKILMAGSDAYSAYAPQIQFSLWVTGREWWDFVAFNPDFQDCPILVNRVYRGDDMIERIDAAMNAAIPEIDAMVEAARSLYARHDGVDSIAEDARNFLELQAMNFDLEGVGHE